MEREEKNKLEKEVLNYYKSVGYDLMIDFQDEYIFMCNTKTMEKVRIYHNSYHIEEY